MVWKVNRYLTILSLLYEKLQYIILVIIVNIEPVCRYVIKLAIHKIKMRIFCDKPDKRANGHSQ